MACLASPAVVLEVEPKLHASMGRPSMPSVARALTLRQAAATTLPSKGRMPCRSNTPRAVDPDIIAEGCPHGGSSSRQIFSGASAWSSAKAIDRFPRIGRPPVKETSHVLAASRSVNSSSAVHKAAKLNSSHQQPGPPRKAISSSLSPAVASADQVGASGKKPGGFSLGRKGDVFDSHLMLEGDYTARSMWRKSLPLRALKARMGPMVAIKDRDVAGTIDLQVSGQAAEFSSPRGLVLHSMPETSQLERADRFIDDLSSSGEDDACDGEDFDYRAFKHQVTACKASLKPSSQPRLHCKPWRDAAKSCPTQATNSLDLETDLYRTDSALGPWTDSRSTRDAVSAMMGAPGYQAPSWITDAQDHETSVGHFPALTEVDQKNMCRVAAILTKFYGWPAGLKDAIRRSRTVANLLSVSEEAWMQRHNKEGPWGEPPTIWVRGGRVYDLRGDRGTVAEFEHGLFVQRVEEDP